MLTRINNILEIINAHTPVPFGGKPYKAAYRLDESNREIMIDIAGRDNGCVFLSCVLSEYDHWEEARLVANDMITEANEKLDELMQMSYLDVKNSPIIADLPKNVRDRIAIKAQLSQQHGTTFTIEHLKALEV